MRRKDRQITSEEAMEALAMGTWGVLSTCMGGTPYGVPLNYVYSRADNALFFHCAPEGKKLAILKSNSRVSFAVVTRAQIVSERFTTYYESVIVSGTASVVEGEQEKKARMRQLCAALTPQTPADDCIKNSLSAAALVRIDIDEIAGKRNH